MNAELGIELVAKVLVVSDGVHEGTREDRAGPKVVARLVEAGWAVIEHQITPDGIDEVAFALRDLVAGFTGLVVTTGGTGVNTHAPAKANFGVGGGCKDGSPTFGHLEYVDHGNGLNVHWTSITGYFPLGGDGLDDHGQPTGSRLVCGTATTNLFGDVGFAVTVRDAGEPGVNQPLVGSIVYTDTLFDTAFGTYRNFELGCGTSSSGPFSRPAATM